jgi:hypothetical protein
LGKSQAIAGLYGQVSNPQSLLKFSLFRSLCREWWQREWLWKEGVGAHARQGDLIILGDVDEIPRPETLAALRACPFQAKHNCANLDGSFFYYSYSGYAGEWLAGPKVCLNGEKGLFQAVNKADIVPCLSSWRQRIWLMCPFSTDLFQEGPGVNTFCS